jgi:hypothetical protein
MCTQTVVVGILPWLQFPQLLKLKLEVRRPLQDARMAAEEQEGWMEPENEDSEGFPSAEKKAYFQQSVREASSQQETPFLLFDSQFQFLTHASETQEFEDSQLPSPMPPPPFATNTPYQGGENATRKSSPVAVASRFHQGREPGFVPSVPLTPQGHATTASPLPLQPTPWQSFATPFQTWRGAGSAFRPQPVRPRAPSASHFENIYGAAGNAVSAPEMHDWRRPDDSSTRGSSARQTEKSEKGEEVDGPSKDKNGSIEKDTSKRKGARSGTTQQAGSQAKKKVKNDEKEANAEDKSSDRFTWTSKATKLLIFLTLRKHWGRTMKATKRNQT